MICFCFVVNISSQGKILSTVFLALNTFKLEITFNEEFSEDIENSKMEWTISCKYLASSNQIE